MCPQYDAHYTYMLNGKGLIIFRLSYFRMIYTRAKSGDKKSLSIRHDVPQLLIYITNFTKSRPTGLAKMFSKS